LSADEVARSGSARTAKNAERAERRRHMTRTVRDLRERLDSGSDVKPAFDRELMTEHARTRLAVAPWLVGLIGFNAVVGVLWVDRALIAAWGAIAVMVLLTGLWFDRAYLKLDGSEAPIAAWRRRLTLADGGHAIAWALFFLLPVDGGVVADVYQFAVVLVVGAISAVLTANLASAMYAATLPITLASAFGFVIRPETTIFPNISHQIVLAGMVLTIQAFFIVIGRRLHQAALSEIEARAEKDTLIGELEQAKAISDESRRKAEEANFAKSRFLATMSHELRTPLNAILGFSEVMQQELMGPLDNTYYKGYVTDIHDSGRHLLELINEILDISRIEAGRYTLNEEATTLPYIVEDCVHMMGLRARNKGQSIVESYEDGLPKIWADERAIRQIVLNILSNAVKFTPSGGTISVKVGWTAGGGQYVGIRDTGPGIPEEEIPIVLSRFGQGSIAIKSAEQGTGLGLNIVQALIKMHGGTFDLKSKLREGTEIIVTFPKSRVLEIMPKIDDRPRARGSAAIGTAGAAGILDAIRRQAGRG
jgi:two-component system cell cycle sensor histidine kinase PleC